MRTAFAPLFVVVLVGPAVAQSPTAFKEAIRRSASAPGHTPVRLLGPAECPVFRLNNFYRFHFQVQSDSSAVLHEVLRNVLALAKPPHGVEFQVDIDPYSMLWTAGHSRLTSRPREPRSWLGLGTSAYF